MAKKGFWRRTFGKKFNIWDFLLLSLLLSYPTYLFYTLNWDFLELSKTLLNSVGAFIWGGILVAYLVRLIVNKAKK